MAQRQGRKNEGKSDSELPFYADPLRDIFNQGAMPWKSGLGFA
jgi:hypothetical protein